ncbi:MAG: hypothetical protein JKX94_03480, partial [Sneathiella sp.]|nr:hypothetical protein [Sneathiella sp.]
SWSALASAQGHKTPLSADHYFDRSDLMLQAAISGLGIAVGRTLLIENDIESGFLKKIGPSAPMKSAYWLICTHDTARTSRFQQLAKWLLLQMKDTQ